MFQNIQTAKEPKQGAQPIPAPGAHATKRLLKQAPIWSRPLPLQPSLKINAPGDKYEQEAERVADEVMRMPDPHLQRATCACGKPMGPGGECAECKRKRLGIQRMASGDAPQTTAPPIVHQALQQPGRPLDSATRNFMEARFGRDLGHVRVHTDGTAAESAQAINARAFTVGRNMVFGAGEYAPQSAAGRTLLAHEITHTVQQQMHPASIQRWSLGTGAPPHPDYTEVPDEHKDRLKAAENILSRIVNNPKDFPGCHKFFEDNCVPGTATSLKEKFDNATVWFDTDDTVFGSGVDTDNVAYSDITFRIGRWFIAGVMIHEFMHRCGQDDEDINDKAIKACKLPDVEIDKGKIVQK